MPGVELSDLYHYDRKKAHRMLLLKVTYIPPAGPLYITWGEIPPNPKTSGQPGESSDARGAMDIVRVCFAPRGFASKAYMQTTFKQAGESYRRYVPYFIRLHWLAYVDHVEPPYATADIRR